MLARSKLIQTAYEVKLVQGLPRQTHSADSESRGRPLLASPLYAAAEEIKAWLDRFDREVGQVFLSEDTFVEFCTHAAQKRLLDAESCTGERALDRDIILALHLCELSKYCPSSLPRGSAGAREQGRWGREGGREGEGGEGERERERAGEREGGRERHALELISGHKGVKMTGRTGPLLFISGISDALGIAHRISTRCKAG
jgi:hypothetical protein